MECDSHDNGDMPKAMPRFASKSNEKVNLWVTLSTCHSLIAAELRFRLRNQHSMTLPRYEAMLELSRHEDGLSMGELSRRLMVSNGNITGITDRLVAEGLVSRQQVPNDRRTHFIKLTQKGRKSLDKVSKSYNCWLEDLLDGLSEVQGKELGTLLHQLEHTVSRRSASDKP